ncbi:MAG: chemotaxis protein CheA [Actinobacteria bacterium]|jgi:two-component system chemotaxis sensor kinase CheA|nr:MAG: chemotaxis protein CheA [Actinomycetota bacterium]
MDMDISQYKELFISEAQEHLEALNQSMVDLEKDPGNPDVLTEIFRSAHTLKGMSATMGFDQLTELSHEMENVLDGLRSGDIEVSTDIVDLLFGCFDMLGTMVADISEESGKILDTRPLIEALRAVYAGEKGAIAGMEAPAGAQKKAKPKRKTGPATGQKRREETSEEEVVEAVPGGEEEEPEVAAEAIAEAPLEEVPGEKPWRLLVTLDKDCVLKSVRVFMIFKKLAQIGRVISSRPSVEDLEDEKFDRSFEVVVSTKEGLESVRKALLTIAEVHEVEVVSAEGAEMPVEEVAAGGIIEDEREKEEAAGDQSQEAAGMSTGPVRTQSVRVNISRLDNLMNLIGELVINRTRLQEIASSMNIGELKEALAQTARLTADLQDEVMKTRMVPVEHIFNRFPRMVRDLAKSREKEVDFVIEGKDIELDRTILDEISDPLMHLLRNAVDHGIDSPEEREARGKPRRGSIRLMARRDRNYVSIEVSDDGKGVDAQKIFDLAESNGLMSSEERKALSEDDILRFLAMPGFSSAEEVSGVSGRGVGLDVVKNKVESLGGMLIMQSVKGEGTTFALKLPLTLAIIQALLVRVRGEIYAIPLGVVAETAVISSHEVKYVSNQEVIFLRDETLPLMRLGRYLGLPDENGQGSFPVVVVEVALKSVAIAVDELMGQQEIVITSLDRFLKRIRGFGGATILGTGEVALILDIPTLLS